MEQRNMLLAFALSIAILLGWGVIFPQPETDIVESKALSENTQVVIDDHQVPELRPVDMDVKSIEQVSSSIEASALKVFYMGNDKLRVGMDDRGWITEGELLAYFETTEPDSKLVSVLHTGEGHNVYVNAGVLGHKRTTPFKQISSTSTANTQTQMFQATLDNGKVWQRSLSLTNGSYAVHVEDRILNGGGMKMFRQVVERNPDKTLDTFYEHMDQYIHMYMKHQ